MRPPVLATGLLVLLAVSTAQAGPYVSAETDFGRLEVVPLAEFDPSPAGEAVPPAVDYWMFSSFEPAPLDDPAAAEAEVLRRAEASRAALAARGLVAADGLAALTPREFTLVVAHVTRAAITVPLTPAGVDEYSLERYLAEGLGVCRHLSRIGEGVAELLRPHCPAARDVRITAYGDHHTHSWLRAAAMVPEGDGWRLVETHLDLTSHTADELFDDVDVVRPDKLRRYPLAAIVLDRAGHHERATREFRAFADDPASANRAAALTELYRSHVARAEWREALIAAPAALAAIEEEQQAWATRSLPTTPDQLVEMRLAVFLALEGVHEVFPEQWAESGLPPADEWAPEIERLQALFEDLSVFAFAIEGDLAALDLDQARRRTKLVTDRAGGDAWAYRAAYAAVLERAKSPFLDRGDSAMLLELAVERHQLLPDDERAAADLSNAMLGRVDALDRAGTPPTAADIAHLQQHLEVLPGKLPESHLVKAWIARATGEGLEERTAYRAVVRTCDALPEEEQTPRIELFRITALVELERLNADDGLLPDAGQRAYEALVAMEGASEALLADPERRGQLAVLWWDAGIRLTIADSDPDLAVQIWRAYVAFAPDDPRAQYGLARGLVQLAIAQLDRRDEHALPTAREAVRALKVAVALDVPVPRSDEYLRLAWFNLATRFEAAGELAQALEIARAMDRALPAEPAGAILVARTLGLLAAEARDKKACTEATPYLDEGETLLAELPAGRPAEDHLVGSTVNAYRSLAIAAAYCGDLDRAMGTVKAGLDRFPREPGLVELRDQLIERMND